MAWSNNHFGHYVSIYIHPDMLNHSIDFLISYGIGVVLKKKLGKNPCLVGDDEGYLGDTVDDVALGHHEGRHPGRSHGRADGVAFLWHVDLAVPTPPGLGRPKHPKNNKIHFWMDKANKQAIKYRQKWKNIRKNKEKLYRGGRGRFCRLSRILSCTPLCIM